MSPRAGFGDRPVRSEAGVEGRLGIVGEVRLTVVDVHEEATLAARRKPGWQRTPEDVGPAADLPPDLVELLEAAIEAVEAAGDRAGDEACGGDPLGPRSSSASVSRSFGSGDQNETSPWWRSEPGRPDRGHRSQRVDGGRVRALEDDALPGDRVDHGRRRAAVPVRSEGARAGGVQDHEHDVRVRELALRRCFGARIAGPMRPRPRPRHPRPSPRRRGLAATEDARRPASSPTRSPSPLHAGPTRSASLTISPGAAWQPEPNLPRGRRRFPAAPVLHSSCAAVARPIRAGTRNDAAPAAARAARSQLRK